MVSESRDSWRNRTASDRMGLHENPINTGIRDRATVAEIFEVDIQNRLAKKITN